MLVEVERDIMGPQFVLDEDGHVGVERGGKDRGGRLDDRDDGSVLP
ncbi:MAG: hypothetical protein L0I76_16075 [Pseudonocardia sp.]|nr:hypothetical protein [Pseudonocardia sp.]